VALDWHPDVPSVEQPREGAVVCQVGDEVPRILVCRGETGQAMPSVAPRGKVELREETFGVRPLRCSDGDSRSLVPDRLQRAVVTKRVARVAERKNISAPDSAAISHIRICERRRASAPNLAHALKLTHVVRSSTVPPHRERPRRRPTRARSRGGVVEYQCRHDPLAHLARRRNKHTRPSRRQPETDASGQRILDKLMSLRAAKSLASILTTGSAEARLDHSTLKVWTCTVLLDRFRNPDQVRRSVAPSLRSASTARHAQPGACSSCSSAQSRSLLLVASTMAGLLRAFRAVASLDSIASPSASLAACPAPSLRAQRVLSTRTRTPAPTRPIGAWDQTPHAATQSFTSANGARSPSSDTSCDVARQLELRRLLR